VLVLFALNNFMVYREVLNIRFMLIYYENDNLLDNFSYSLALIVIMTWIDKIALSPLVLLLWLNGSLSNLDPMIYGLVCVKQ
jgi:hypothetical protein